MERRDISSRAPFTAASERSWIAVDSAVPPATNADATLWPTAGNGVVTAPSRAADRPSAGASIAWTIGR
jgi:hypothetical protein